MVVRGDTALPEVAGLKLMISFNAGSVIQSSCSTLSQAIAVGVLPRRPVRPSVKTVGYGRCRGRIRQSSHARIVNQMLPLSSTAI